MLPLSRKLDAIEGRMVKMMAKDDNMKVKLDEPYKHIKAAQTACNEGNHGEALEHVQRFTNIMREYKENGNV